jgi:hypothetical protein
METYEEEYLFLALKIVTLFFYGFEGVRAEDERIDLGLITR